jgi:hypothetical protein
MGTGAKEGATGNENGSTIPRKVLFTRRRRRFKSSSGREGAKWE